MPHTNCSRHLTQELSKQYLNGKLSSKEMYAVEDRLLENDFYFEAMEGLEVVPWDRCQQAVDQVREQIIANYKVKQRSSWNQRTVAYIALGTLVLGVGLAWFAMSGPNKSADLTAEGTENLQPAAKGPSLAEKNPDISWENKPGSDSLNAFKDTITMVENVNEASASELLETKDHQLVVEGTKETVISRRPQKTSSPVEAHIAVGRIIDINGIALQNVMVIAGPVSDVTDKSGYYAIRVPYGLASVQIKHSGFTANIEIDTKENWEIVLDLTNGSVKDFYPINGGNRFK